jgi:hypothetical protein
MPNAGFIIFGRIFTGSLPAKPEARPFKIPTIYNNRKYLSANIFLLISFQICIDIFSKVIHNIHNHSKVIENDKRD